MVSALFFGIVCWSLTRDLTREWVEEVAKVHTARKLDIIMTNPSRPLHMKRVGQLSRRGNNILI